MMQAYYTLAPTVLLQTGHMLLEIVSIVSLYSGHDDRPCLKLCLARMHGQIQDRFEKSKSIVCSD